MLLSESTDHQVVELVKTGGDIGSKMNAQRAPSPLCQDGEVASGLRCLDHAEGIFLTGHRQIFCIICRNLQENSGVRASLIGLAGGVKKAGAESKHCGNFFPIPNREPYFLKNRSMSLRHFDIGKQCCIVTRTNSSKMCLKQSCDRAVDLRDGK